MVGKVHLFDTYQTARREQRLRHGMLLLIAILFSWVLWTLVNWPVYRSLSGLALWLEIGRELLEHVVEITLLLEISLLYSRLVVAAFWDAKKTIGNRILQVMILVVLNGLASTGMAAAYQAIFPEKEGLFFRILFTDYVDLSVLTTAYLVSFLINRYRDEEESRLRAESAAQEKELSLLRSRVQNQALRTDNHFVFNSFSTLDSLIEEDPDQARRFLGDLTDAYRYLLLYADKERVPLRDELRFVRDYARNLSQRYGGVSVEIDPALDASDGWVCPVAVQSLVENAVKHNRHGRADGLRIRLRLDGDRIVVSNNILPLVSPVPSTGTGLRTLKDRYRLVSGRDIEVVDDGTEFRVSLPLLKSDSHEDLDH